ncbi:DinB family protein [Mucilaginibacter sp. AK015]|uniref:DinB family protein n=1 Tax=Mucilaginibacter sp. AK015 TaxID=2723072 RepID=UPI00160BE7C2|nr:DinB family protein [Mucilaginibacter sp. AK015]MBB5394743.1 hypothetical protein [Mucilaginibacter sp. AK015]
MNIEQANIETAQTFDELLAGLSSITDEQANTVPFAGSWTAAQVAQHVILSAGSFVELLNGPVTDTNRDPEAGVEQLKSIFLDFDTKLKSPDFIIPEDKIYQKQQLIEKLQLIKTNLLQAIDTLDVTKTCKAFEMPVMGYITRAEAITFTIVHTKRHVHQIKRIAAALAGH